MLYHLHFPVPADTFSVISAYEFNNLCRVKSLSQDDMQTLNVLINHKNFSIRNYAVRGLFVVVLSRGEIVLG